MKTKVQFPNCLLLAYQLYKHRLVKAKVYLEQ
jgi:hypothetical protein